MTMKHVFSILILTVVIALLSACENQNYETGDSSYSYMKADLCDVHTLSDCSASSITMDNGSVLPLQSSYTASWMTRPDTTYRALAYYDEVESSSGKAQAKIHSLQSVAVLKPIIYTTMKEIKTDPVEVVSLWKGNDGRYLNFRLKVKTGSTDEIVDGQTVALVKMPDTSSSDGQTCSHIMLYYDQGGVPEYYSTTLLFSLPISAIKADSLNISIKTHSGTYQRTFSIE